MSVTAALGDIDAEASLLGYLLTASREGIFEVALEVTGDDFYRPAHAHVFDAVVTLAADGITSDAHAVRSWLAERQLLDAIGGPATILELAGQVVAGWRPHATAVARGGQRRRLLTATGNLEAAIRDGGDPGPALEQVNRLHSATAVRTLADRLVSTAEVEATGPTPCLIDPVLPTGSLVTIFGSSGAGKSFVTTDMAMHLALGLDWHGLTVPGPVRVLYIAAEGAGGLGRRITAWRAHHGAHVVDGVSWVLGAVNLTSAAETAAVAALVAREHYGVVIYDTLARNTVGADENAAKDMGQVVAAADRVREAGAAVILVHHSGKDTERGARGSSALKAAVDIELEVTRTTSGTITMRNTKAKDTDTAPPMAFELHPTLTSAVLIPVDAPAPSAWHGPTRCMETAVAFITEQGGEWSPRKLRDTLAKHQTSFRYPVVQEALGMAVADGLLEVHDGPRSSRLYRLPTPASDEAEGVLDAQ